MNENDISYEIRGAIFNVYNALDPGLLESVYEQILVYELEKRGLHVQSQVPVQIMYDGHNFGSSLRADLIVEEKVIVELKSVEELKDIHFKQLLSYLRLTGLKLGLLVNFNELDMKEGIKRIINGHI